MNAERMKLILPQLDEVMTSDEPLCVTFESPEGNPWLQATRDALHLWYPYDDMPLDRLERLGLLDLPRMCLADWDRSTALIGHTPVDVEALGRWIDTAFAKLYDYGDRADFAIDVLPMGPFA